MILFDKIMGRILTQGLLMKENLMHTMIILLILAFAFIYSLESYIRMFHPDTLYYGFGLYFQEWTSEAMGQTLPIQQLYDDPLRSLYYLHIQPPMLDTIRAFVAAFSPSDGSYPLLFTVDGRLYVIWAALYAILAVLVFEWIRFATGSTKVASVAYVFWLFHPGALAMATLLDSTMLSSVLITWMLYELWRFSFHAGSELRLTIAAFLLFFTRTIFQWYFVPIILLALWISGASRKSIVKVILPVSVVVVIFLLKQFILFGTFSTTTFQGEHKLGLIQYYPTVDELATQVAGVDYKYPDDAQRFTGKYNNEQQVITNIVYGRIFSERLRCCLWESLEIVGRSIYQNFRVFWRPTSQYSVFKYLDRLFWRGIYDFVFSRAFILPLFLSITFWICQNFHSMRAVLPSLGMMLVLLYILTISLLANRYDWVESNRLKFFLEPTFYVFVVTQSVLAFRWVQSRLPITVKGNIGISK